MTRARSALGVGCQSTDHHSGFTTLSGGLYPVISTRDGARARRRTRAAITTAAAMMAAAAFAGPAQASLSVAGPVSPLNFPSYYEDSTGLQIALCIDDPGCPASPQLGDMIGPDGEAFYQLANATLDGVKVAGRDASVIVDFNVRGGVPGRGSDHLRPHPVHREEPPGEHDLHGRASRTGRVRSPRTEAATSRAAFALHSARKSAAPEGRATSTPCSGRRSVRSSVARARLRATSATGSPRRPSRAAQSATASAFSVRACPTPSRTRRA